MNRCNFMKDSGRKIVALDFGASCFLPLSFFIFALREGDDFTQRIARRLKHPKSPQLNALLTASYAMVPYGTDKIGEHIPCSLFFFFPLPYKETDFNVLHRYPTQAQAQGQVDMAHKPSCFTCLSARGLS